MIREILKNSAPERWDYHSHVDDELDGSIISGEALAGIHRRLDQLVLGSEPSFPLMDQRSQSSIEADGQCVYVPSNLQL